MTYASIDDDLLKNWHSYFIGSHLLPNIKRGPQLQINSKTKESLTIPNVDMKPGLPSKKKGIPKKNVDKKVKMPIIGKAGWYLHRGRKLKRQLLEGQDH